MKYLSPDELGLRYVYLSIANLVQLFEFGFNTTFARNIVYVLSGAKKLTAKGCSPESSDTDVDWHLLNTVICSSKLVYAGIAIVTLFPLGTIGTAYIGFVTKGMESLTVWLTWVLFCIAVFLNMYFLYSITLLRGYGDVAGENKAKTFGKIGQLAVSGIALVLGYGLIGATIGYLTNAVVIRMLALIYVKRHREIEEGRRQDDREVGGQEVRSILKTVYHIAWRDGTVQLSLYASTQAMSILASLYLGLAETGPYSILLQFSSAVYMMAQAYPKSFTPALQFACAIGDVEKQRGISSTGIAAYWILIIFGTIGVCCFVLPLLPLIRPGVVVNYALFLALCLYMSLLQQHSLFCSYIICFNEIPYFVGYIVAAVLGLALVWLFCGLLGWGAWGIVSGQALSQAVYNNWKWPMYFCSKIGITYRKLIMDGLRYWRHRVMRMLRSR